MMNWFSDVSANVSAFSSSVCIINFGLWIGALYFFSFKEFFSVSIRSGNSFHVHFSCVALCPVCSSLISFTILFVNSCWD